MQPGRSQEPRRFFYGWVIVACAFLVLAVSYGIQFSYGVFMPAISAETGWGRTSLSLPYSLYVLVYSAFGFVTGVGTDRWGPRIVIGAGGVLLGAGIALLSRADALWHLYLWLGCVAAPGMSAAFVPCNATVVRWFTRRRGLALGLSASGASFGNFVVPPLAAGLIGLYGWRDAYLLLGLGGGAVIVSCALLTVRDPEARGLYPDGVEPTVVSPAAPVEPDPAAEARDTWTLASARRTLPFWLLMGVFTSTWLVIFLPLVHVVPFAVDLGVPRVQAATLISAIGLAGFAGRLIAGPLSDRCGRMGTLAACLGLEVVAFGGLALSTDWSALSASAFLFGLGYGGSTALFPAIVGDFYGRTAVGAIVGFFFSLAGSAAAVGPLAAGYIYDAYGGYRLAFVLSAVLNLAGIAFLWFVKKPSAPPVGVRTSSGGAEGRRMHGPSEAR